MPSATTAAVIFERIIVSFAEGRWDRGRSRRASIMPQVRTARRRASHYYSRWCRPAAARGRTFRHRAVILKALGLCDNFRPKNPLSKQRGFTKCGIVAAVAERAIVPNL